MEGSFSVIVMAVRGKSLVRPTAPAWVVSGRTWTRESSPTAVATAYSFWRTRSAGPVR